MWLATRLRNYPAPLAWLVRSLVVAVLLVGFVAIACRLYWQFHNSVFALDDTGLINFFLDNKISPFAKTLGNASSNRWRPVTDVAYLLASDAFGRSFYGWWQLNMLLLGGLATAASLLFSWLSKRLWIGIALGLLVVTARFSQYQAVQATALVESIGSLLFVGFLAFVVIYLKTGKQVVLAIGAVDFLLLVLTHERYQGLFIAVLAVMALDGRLRVRSRLLWGAIYLVPLLFLTFVKSYLLHIPLAVGPGSSSELGFSPITLWENTVISFGDVFGINLGPSYLAGLTFTAQSLDLEGVSLIVFFLTVVALMARPCGARSKGTEPRAYFWIKLRNGVVAAALVVGTILPFAVTSRVEQRFIVNVGVLLLAGIAFAVRPYFTEGRHRAWVTASIVIALVVSSLFMNFQYRENINALFFRGQQIGVQQNLSVLVPASRTSTRTGKKIYFVFPGQDTGYGPYFSSIIDANTGLTPKIVVVKSISDIPVSEVKAPVLSLDASGALVKIR